VGIAICCSLAVISLEGNHVSTRTLKITADVVAREVIIYGEVKGNLAARDRIEIKKDGSVLGDLLTGRIVIEDGAIFKGSIEIVRQKTEAAGTEKPSQSFAATASAADSQQK